MMVCWGIIIAPPVLVKAAVLVHYEHRIIPRFKEWLEIGFFWENLNKRIFENERQIKTVP